MTKLTLAIYDKERVPRKSFQGEEEIEKDLVVTAENFVHLSMRKFEYQEGDQIVVEMDESGRYLWVKLDETLESSLIYLPGNNGPMKFHFIPIVSKPDRRLVFLGDDII